MENYNYLNTSNRFVLYKISHINKGTNHISKSFNTSIKIKLCLTYQANRNKISITNIIHKIEK